MNLKTNYGLIFRARHRRNSHLRIPLLRINQPSIIHGSCTALTGPRPGSECARYEFRAFLMAYGAKLWSACSLLPLLPAPACWRLISSTSVRTRGVAGSELPNVGRDRKRASGRESGSKLHALQSFARPWSFTTPFLSVTFWHHSHNRLIYHIHSGFPMNLTQVKFVSCFVFIDILGYTFILPCIFPHYH